MDRDIPLTLQTAYADLLDRCASAAFDDAFSANGVFVSKAIRGRRYWYFQSSSEGDRKQKYVGPETRELLDRISHHRTARSVQRDRRAAVSTLVRSGGLPRPLPEIGDVVLAMSNAGIFRLRSVLIGTVAYQTYSALLGTKLPLALLQTSDIDIAQFKNVSVAIQDKTPAMQDILRQVDASFRPVPHLRDSRRATAYQAASGLRVDFLTPNQGAETDAPQPLPALGTDAQPLRFLDFILREPESAIILHESGIYVHVPAPQRYALHKLIVARRRRESAVKRDKDIQQATALLDVLLRKRPRELSEAWNEAFGRGKTWRQLLGEGMGMISSATRDNTLKTVGAPRNVVPGLDIQFDASAARYDSNREIICFLGEAGAAVVRCAISREALVDHFGPDHLDKEGRLNRFRENRSLMERIARIKYLAWPVEEADAVMIMSEDVPELLQQDRERKAAKL